METVRNAKVFVRYSSLIVQHAMTEEFYFFWKEMQEQNEGGAIFDKPPFNLHSNFHSLNGDKKVSGYFGVVQEQAMRWYFDIRDLSYYVENTATRGLFGTFSGYRPGMLQLYPIFFWRCHNVKPNGGRTDSSSENQSLRVSLN